MEIEPDQEDPRLANTEDWVAVAEALSPGEAEGIAELLQEAGIPFKEDEQVNRNVTHGSIVEAPVAFTDVFVILVPRPSVEQAKQLLRCDGYRVLRARGKKPSQSEGVAQLVGNLFGATRDSRAPWVRGLLAGGGVFLLLAFILLFCAPQTSFQWDFTFMGATLVFLGCSCITAGLVLRYFVPLTEGPEDPDAED